MLAAMIRALALYLALTLLAPALARADRTVLETDWAELAEAQDLPGEVLVPAGRQEAVLHLEATGVHSSVEVLVLEHPALERAVFELRGVVRTEGVEPAGMLEMWVDYGPHGRFFSRTQGQGTHAPLVGTSDGFRRFVVPFTGRDGQPVERIELYVVLPAQGVVELGGIRLVEIDQVGLSAIHGAWWDQYTGKLITYAGSAGIGLLGCLVGLLALFRLGSGLVMFLLHLMLVSCMGLGLCGVIAMGFEQEGSVYFPFLVMGGVGIVCAVALYTPVRRRFDGAMDSR